MPSPGLVRARFDDPKKQSDVLLRVALADERDGQMVAGPHVIRVRGQFGPELARRIDQLGKLECLDAQVGMCASNSGIQLERPLELLLRFVRPVLPRVGPSCAGRPIPGDLSANPR